jgi:O-antigen ligase
MDRLARAGFALAVAGGLLAMAPPLAEPFVLVKLAVLGAGGALLWAGRWGRPLRRTPLDAPLGALWAVLAVSAWNSADRWTSLLGAYPQTFYGLLPLALCGLLFHAAAAADGAEADAALDAALAAACVLSAYGVVQRVFGDPLIRAPLPDGRITSAIGSPVMLGACLSLLLPLALHRALDRRSPLARAAFVLMLPALALTRARGAWLAAAAGVAGYLLLSGRVKTRLGRRGWTALALGLLLTAGAAARLRGKRDSDALRLETFKSAAAAFAGRPALGWGPDAFLLAFRRHETDEFLRLSHASMVVQYSAHDDLLQAAVTLGAAGLLAYLWLQAALFLRLRRLLADRARRAEAAALAGGLGALWLVAKVDPVSPSGVLLAALAAGLACRGSGAAVPRAPSRALAAAAVLLGLGGAGVYGVYARADFLYRRGSGAVASSPAPGPAYMAGVADIKRAGELAPWELDYLSRRLDVIFRVSGLAVPAQGKALLDKAVELSAEAERRHPEEPAAHELRATALALRAQRFGGGGLEEALAEIKTASALAPTFVFSLKRRMEIARALGDRAEYEAARADYRRVAELTGQDPAWTPSAAGR